MKNDREAQFAEPTNPQRAHQQSFRCGPFLAALVVLSFSGGAVADNGDSPTQLRRFIGHQVGGIEKLMVPALDSEIPSPRLPDGSLDPAFQTTEAKRYLGKLLFHDPIRTARIFPDFGGVPATKQTASCGSCHLGEAASRAGAPESPARTSAKKRLSSGAVPPTTTTRLVSG